LLEFDGDKQEEVNQSGNHAEKSYLPIPSRMELAESEKSQEFFGLLETVNGKVKGRRAIS